MSKPRKKPTQKQQAFARAVVETGNQSEAYRRAYDAKNMSADAIKVEACKLAQNPNVAQTLAQLQHKHAERHEITIDKLTEMAIAAYEHAMKDDKGASAAVSAVMAVGKLHGLIVEKKEVTRKRDAADFNDAELYAIAGLGRKGTDQAEASPQEPDSLH